MASKELSEYSLSDLAQIIRLNERSVFLINRARNRDDIDALNAQVSNIESGFYIQKVLDEITLRTGKSSIEDLRELVQGELQKQEDQWDKEWKSMYQEGAVIKPKDSDNIMEVIRTYLPVSCCMGPKEYILVRFQGKLYTRLFDDRDVTRFEKIDEKPIYLKKNLIIKHDEEKEFRESKSTKTSVEWHKIYDWKAIFEHKGFNDIFERIHWLNKPHKNKTQKNEIILAKSQKNGLFYEFTTKDLPLINYTSREPIYTIRDGVMSTDTLEQFGVIKPSW